VGGIKVVLAGFIDDTYQAESSRFFVRKELIKLSKFQRGGIVVVFHTNGVLGNTVYSLLRRVSA